ncbi:TraR/DksA family transcriptional regulator [Kineosporia babensis]|uniref:TraR/DksA C4-type zinc finger protein n=1 Tax=Kineosporia babensis TaxID=499548 RepID=A0A9X1NA15_9ACTN|nr:TraR/DksA C4-type zinc finger protein [Kineosporia babensis]MCD5309919.1 TraR/DksA C4-type zinc finger protein [Kineosporia babensis]
MDERQAILSTVKAESQATLAALEHEHARMIEASLDSNADDEHDPEGATIAFEREQLAAALARTRAALARIDQAQAELQAGRYGVCAGCGEPIAVARLEARPLATHCISCADGRRV